MSLSRRLLRLLIVTVLSLAAVVLAAELWASTTEAGNSAYFVEDAELGLVRKPDLDGFTAGNGRWIPVRINKHGLRGEDLPLSADPAERRILCVGDSFTFGGGVETHEAWPQQLQARLGPPESSGWRVLNGGANGWDTPWQRQYLEGRGLANLKPQIVVLGWNWNDLEADPDAPAEAVRHFIRREHSPLLRHFADWPALRGTHLYRWLASRETASGQVRSDADLARDYEVYRAKREAQAIAPERRVEEVRRRRFGDSPPDLDFWLASDTPAWKLVREEFAKIAAACRQRGVKLLVALLPEPTWDGPGTFPATDRMTALLDALDVPWVDVQPDFLQSRSADGTPAGKRPGLWLRYDPFHPTPEGQAIFAQTIGAKLTELGWLTE